MEKQVLKTVISKIAKSVDEDDNLIARAKALSDEMTIQDEIDAKKGKKTHRVTAPWLGGGEYYHNLLGTSGKHVGYRPRWVCIDRIEQKLSEGWRMVNPKNYGALSTNIPGEESQIEPGIIRRRDMVLMELPEESAQARAKYYAEMNERQVRKGQDIINDASAQTGIPTYDPMNPSRED